MPISPPLVSKLLVVWQILSSERSFPTLPDTRVAQYIKASLNRNVFLVLKHSCRPPLLKRTSLCSRLSISLEMFVLSLPLLPLRHPCLRIVRHGPPLPPPQEAEPLAWANDRGSHILMFLACPGRREAFLMKGSCQLLFSTCSSYRKWAWSQSASAPRGTTKTIWSTLLKPRDRE